MTGADIAKFREFVEVLRKANSPELMTQADMRCLLAIAASSHSARLANQELQVQAEWASLVAILYRTDSIHAEIIALYSALADALAQARSRPVARKGRTRSDGRNLAA